jgi:hypothetical protein
LGVPRLRGFIKGRLRPAFQSTGFQYREAVSAGSAEAAWADLVGFKFMKRPEFAYLQHNPALPNVLLNEYSIATNDLYAFTKPNSPKWRAGLGDVHYNKEGQNVQGDAVAKFIPCLSG